MAKVTFKNNPVNTIGNLPEIGKKAPDFKLVKTDLSETTLADYVGKKVILNIFPSLDTGTCAASVRRFNKEATGLQNTVVLCISKDLPFAHTRFCTAEGIENVVNASEFRDNSFGNAYNVLQADGPLKGLFARAIVVLDEKGTVVYNQLVSEITEEPDYESAIKAL